MIPAHPLALNQHRKLDERRQRALTRYYCAAGSSGIAVGVHTTQFEIRNPGIDLLEPVLTLAAETMDQHVVRTGKPIIKIAGIVGETRQACEEAKLAVDLGYHIGLVSLSALQEANTEALCDHLKEIARIIPLMGFYLQPAVGGRLLPFEFWQKAIEIPNLLAIKIAPFNRYQTLDVVRAVWSSERQDVALYTGNDDNICLDLLTPFHFGGPEQRKPQRMVGGLLGHWACWTRSAVELVEQLKTYTSTSAPAPQQLLQLAQETTDANAAIFDAANGFAGCIPGVHEILRRQGFLEGTWMLNPQEVLSKSQFAEIDRIYKSYPHLNDDHFVQENLHKWLD